jgi:hypothetical protein
MNKAISPRTLRVLDHLRGNRKEIIFRNKYSTTIMYSKSPTENGIQLLSVIVKGDRNLYIPMV